jgi:hypothetical protein
MKVSLVENSPFSLFSIKDLFSDNLLNSLSEEFPSEDLFHHKDLANGKRYGDHTQSVFEKFILENSRYLTFYNQITSYEFVSQILRALSDTDELQFLKIHRSTIKRKTHSEFTIRKKSRFAKRFRLKIGYEFSLMQNGSFLAPHTDSASKLLSILIPLPHQPLFNENISKEPGTQFWKSKLNSNLQSNWYSASLSEVELEKFYQNHECFFQIPFTATQHFGFCKSDVSWHSVPIVQEGINRKSINITFWINETRRQKRQNLTK